MTLIITIVGVMTTFILYGYRIDEIEKDIVEHKAKVTLLEAQNSQIQIQLAQIQVDVQYIKANLDRLSNRQLGFTN